MKSRSFLKGQSTLEYAVLIAVVVAGLLAMQYYMKRGVQGKIRESADDIGAQFAANSTVVDKTTTYSGKTVQTVTSGKTTSSSNDTMGRAEVRTEYGKETVGDW